MKRNNCHFSFLIPLLLILSCFFFACDKDDPDDPIDPVGPVDPVDPSPITRPAALGNDGINQDKEYGWDAGNLGPLTATITGNVTSAQYFYAKGLDAGWNAGNALDSPQESWTPKLNQEIFNGVKAQGFRIVRIPVSWSYYRESGTATITTTYMNRVAEVVGYAHTAGLAVIINTHHDNGWFNLNTALNEPDYTTITAQFTALWEQIAEEFKEYGDWLIFEPLNEPRVQTGGVTYWNGAPDGKEAVFDILNQWNQEFVNTIRASGGNNAHRYLLVKGYAAKPFLVISHLQLPTDSSPNKLIYDFHYYDPEGLCLNGNTTVWSVASNGRRIKYDFEDVYNVFKTNGMPGIIGECGVSYQGAREGAEATAANASRNAYLEHMGRTAREFGITPILWDNGQYDRPQNNENFGLIDRETGVVNSDNSQDAIDAFIKGIRTDP